MSLIRPVKTSTPLSASRITYITSTPFNTVESRLRASIIQPTTSPGSFVSSLNSSDMAGKSAFEAKTKPLLGPHQFMNMLDPINHGAWMHFYSAANAFGPDGRVLQSKRFIFGNPFVAITMLSHDLNAGLWAPVEVIMVENPEGGCRVVYLQPSSVIAGYDGAGEGLKKAAEALDDKLDTLIRDICS